MNVSPAIKSRVPPLTHTPTPKRSTSKHTPTPKHSTSKHTLTMPAPVSKDHLLTLKVMRLSRSTFHQSAPINAEKDDLIYTATQDLMDQERTHDALSDRLVLPQNFGRKYTSK
ncbi:hypothetical protein SARC_03325 [Sphaeroforma arctica JP610]|uniref:Trafficking protein particle complex subunit 13 N-terminal domain-containing protein n=1 Tax=Sphaeroforma arctica JP610 TaxID=667725 RepID=A0A0L0G6F2_9EUKA|nr:hypothetical protein SARC_03325 [Sphaeroforma arctica JP610]KNC84461.1 hypothetical protein SARC_03325 [Sphaeroforma arctica JP610]|eukprot:XP_014158363.1 hypothetical protein SARC_03325 [Sphaeroforma arctica JP610]